MTQSEQTEIAKRLYGKGYSLALIATSLKIRRGAVSQLLKDAGVPIQKRTHAMGWIR